MLTLADPVARYWICGGEILALGGPLPLAASEGSSAGCRVIDREQLARLADWHRGEAAARPELAYHRLCLRDATAVLAALAAVPGSGFDRGDTGEGR